MSAGSRKIILAALFANLGIAIAKFIAAFITRSAAMLAEAVHSVADTANQIFLLIGIRLSKREPTPRHPFGYGKERYFWAFIVAMSLFTMGAVFSVYEGLLKISSPHPLESILVSVIVLGVSILLELYSFRAAILEFNRLRGDTPVWKHIRETKDPITITVLFEDAAAMIGLLVALAGIALAHETGNPLFDGLASVIIGLILGVVAVLLAWESKSLLIGEAASDADITTLRRVIESHDGVRLSSDLITMHLEPSAILVNVTLDFDERLNSTEVEELTARIEQRMKEEVPSVKYVYIEASSFARPEERG